MARLSSADLFTAQLSPTYITGQLIKVSRIFLDLKSTEDEQQHVNIDGCVGVILSEKWI